MPGPIPEDRPLSQHEYALARWMLEHGQASDAAGYLSQLDRARVTSRCPCGCASIDFTIAGEPEPSGGMRLLGDFLYGDEDRPFGIFIFHRNGVLGGIEISSYSESECPRTLPDIASLRPFPGPLPPPPVPSRPFESMPPGTLVTGSGPIHPATFVHQLSRTTGNTPTTPARSTRSRSTP
jgi:hypothetical protein